jgi:cystathionine beta-lyase/cystathionine gamma-synthase
MNFYEGLYFPCLIHFSIGMEAAKDLIEDLNNALENVWLFFS